MFGRKLSHPLAGGWLSFCSIALAVSLAGYCQGQVTMEKAPAKAGSAAKAAAGSADKAKAAMSAEARSVAVGKAFPDFELKDQDGGSFKLSETLKKGPVVLVVYRSADW